MEILKHKGDLYLTQQTVKNNRKENYKKDNLLKNNKKK